MICRVCETDKPTDQFGLRERGRRRSDCLVCNAARSKRYAAQHCEAIKLRRQAHYLGNRAGLLSKQGAYSRANREREAERSRLWRANHPDRMRKLNAGYYGRHRAQLLEWARGYRLANPDVIRAKWKRDKARRRGAIGHVAAVEWRLILDYFGRRCAYCLTPLVTITQDHVVPISRGGNHVAENVVPACETCNFKKHDKTPVEFLWALSAEAAA